MLQGLWQQSGPGCWATAPPWQHLQLHPQQGLTGELSLIKKGAAPEQSDLDFQQSSQHQKQGPEPGGWMNKEVAWGRASAVTKSRNLEEDHTIETYDPLSSDLLRALGVGFLALPFPPGHPTASSTSEDPENLAKGMLCLLYIRQTGTAGLHGQPTKAVPYLLADNKKKD